MGKVPEVDSNAAHEAATSVVGSALSGGITGVTALLALTAGLHGMPWLATLFSVAAIAMVRYVIMPIYVFWKHYINPSSRFYYKRPRHFQNERYGGESAWTRPCPCNKGWHRYSGDIRACVYCKDVPTNLN